MAEFLVGSHRWEIPDWTGRDTQNVQISWSILTLDGLRSSIGIHNEELLSGSFSWKASGLIG